MSGLVCNHVREWKESSLEPRARGRIIKTAWAPRAMAEAPLELKQRSNQHMHRNTEDGVITQVVSPSFQFRVIVRAAVGEANFIFMQALMCYA